MHSWKTVGGPESVRSEQKSILGSVLSSDQPEFVAIYGRRRVGKTFLISEFFEGKGVYFEIAGSRDSGNEVHLARFCSELSYKFYQGRNAQTCRNWETAFGYLRDAVDASLQQDPARPIILFFDELPWLARRGTDFLGALGQKAMSPVLR